MRTVFFIALILFLTSIYATSFDKRISHAEDERINDILEYPNFYILSGSIKINGGFNTYILKIDKQGNILKDTIILSGSFAANLLKISDNKFVVISANSINYPYKTRMEYGLFDTSLSHIYTKNLYFPDSLYAMRYYSIVSKDSTILISGTLNKYSSSQPVNIDPFVYKVSTTGDSLALSIKYNSTSNIDQAFNTVELKGKYYVFMSDFTNYSWGSFLICDKNLNSIDTIDIPNDLYTNYSAILMKDSTFLILTISANTNGVYISKIDTNGVLGVSKMLGKSSEYPYPAYQNSISKNKNYIFSVRNRNFPLSSPFFGIGRSSNLVVSKMDNNLDALWEWNYGGDTFYHVYNILATADMGCIIIGNVNDTINHNLNRDIFIIKLDSNGTTTWTQNIPIPQVGVELSPNPASTTISLKLTNINQKIQNYRILDLQGKTLLQQQAYQNHIQINISSLPSGLYIIEGQTASGAIFRRKFVKE